MKSKQAFTIVEVLVVIGIIAILTVIIFPSINNIRAKNRDTERVADIATLQLGLSLYKNQSLTGEYPPDLLSLVPKYVPADAIVGPDGKQYPYVPLERGSTKCTYYQLGTILELASGQIDMTNTFSTKVTNTGEPDPLAANGYTYCAGYSGQGIDGIATTTNLMYSVHP